MVWPFQQQGHPRYTNKPAPLPNAPLCQRITRPGSVRSGSTHQPLALLGRTHTHPTDIQAKANKGSCRRGGVQWLSRQCRRASRPNALLPALPHQPSQHGVLPKDTPTTCTLLSHEPPWQPQSEKERLINGPTRCRSTGGGFHHRLLVSQVCSLSSAHACISSGMMLGLWSRGDDRNTTCHLRHALHQGSL